MYFNAPRLQQRVLIKKNSLGSMPPNPPSSSKLAASPLDRQTSVFIVKTQSHGCILLFAYYVLIIYLDNLY